MNIHVYLYVDNPVVSIIAFFVISFLILKISQEVRKWKKSA